MVNLGRYISHGLTILSDLSFLQASLRVTQMTISENVSFFYG